MRSACTARRHQIFARVYQAQILPVRRTGVLRYTTQTDRGKPYKFTRKVRQRDRERENACAYVWVWQVAPIYLAAWSEGQRGHLHEARRHHVLSHVRTEVRSQARTIYCRRSAFLWIHEAVSIAAEGAKGEYPKKKSPPLPSPPPPTLRHHSQKNLPK